MGRTIADDILGSRTTRNTINSKQKGNRNEVKAAKWLQKWTGEEFTRTPSSGGLRWGADASFACGDVVCKNQNFDFKFAVETKHLKGIEFKVNLRKGSKIYTVFAQAQRDADRAGKLPMVMLRANGMAEGTYHVFFRYSVMKLVIAEAIKLKLVTGLKDTEFMMGAHVMLTESVLIGVTSEWLLKIPYEKFANRLPKA